MENKDEKQSDEIHFVRKPAKQGDYYIFSIPKALIDNGKVKPNKTYQVIITPIEELELEDGDLIMKDNKISFSEHGKKVLDEIGKRLGTKDRKKIVEAAIQDLLGKHPSDIEKIKKASEVNGE